MTHPVFILTIRFIENIWNRKENENTNTYSLNIITKVIKTIVRYNCMNEISES